ncbi:hypothetical protein LTR37_012591 [Vermiconidia calcicola]|uniref:Uncharacterized protein n=1 Tax=Vermiconidia calcicola TaxID=1690605 RepID=A0ACC3N0K3_9PEZI|nr:hypothetical protein LTR37_012591 [Vermiconidia calcicola]
MFGRKKKTEDTDNDDFHPSTQQVVRATRTRYIWALLTSLLLLISVVFAILVEIGNTRISPTLNRIHFIRLDLSSIIPVRVPNSILINSIAQSLGLHDFYTIGLWNFCEGYNGEGVTDCSKPQTLWWFNPVDILRSELLQGATIALPAEVNDTLDLIHQASFWMFGLFFGGVCLSFIMIFLVPFSVYSRWATLPIAIVTSLAALATTVAAVIATVMFVIMQNTITSATQINIGAQIGVEMFVFMWIAVGTAVSAAVIQMSLCCCCASRRDVKTGRKLGSKKAWRDSDGYTEKHDESVRSNDGVTETNRGSFRAS